MGYCYGPHGLACDKCGVSGGVRKRKCPHTVTDENGHTLPYCPPPALCDPCYRELGGPRGVHGQRCTDGAAASQAQADRIREHLAAGDLRVRAAWGAWHATVPVGWTGVLFEGRNQRREYHLVPAAEYDPSTRAFLSDYATRSDWASPDAA